jgi:fucose permease
VLRYDALQIGLALLPVALAIGTLSVDISARLCDRFGARAVLLSGLTFTLAGLALFARAHHLPRTTHATSCRKC